VKPKHQRLIFVVVSMAFLCTAVLLVMQAFKQNIVYFYSPSDIMATTPAPGKIRVGGLVKMGSFEKDDIYVRFYVTDNQHEVKVYYKGLVPSLFREGQGVIVEGAYSGDSLFADTILAKHDENYMPKEVVETLKKSGKWKGQDGQ